MQQAEHIHNEWHWAWPQDFLLNPVAAPWTSPAPACHFEPWLRNERTPDLPPLEGGSPGNDLMPEAWETAWAHARNGKGAA